MFSSVLSSRSSAVTVSRDTLGDARYRGSSFVTGPPHARFFAGAPITFIFDDQVSRVGGVFILDQTQRTEFSVKDKQFLLDVAAIASDTAQLLANDCSSVDARLAEEQHRYITCTAHDLRTPLTVFKLAATQVLSYFKSRKAKRDAQAQGRRKSAGAGETGASGGTESPESNLRAGRRHREDEHLHELEQANDAVDMMEETVCNAIDSARARWGSPSAGRPPEKSQPGNGAADLPRIPDVNVRDLLGTCQRLHNRHHGEAVSVSAEVGDDVPLRVHCDGPVVKRVLVNFITNAFKHATGPSLVSSCSSCLSLPRVPRSVPTNSSIDLLGSIDSDFVLSFDTVTDPAEPPPPVPPRYQLSPDSRTSLRGHPQLLSVGRISSLSSSASLSTLSAVEEVVSVERVLTCASNKLSDLQLDSRPGPVLNDAPLGPKPCPIPPPVTMATSSCDASLPPSKPSPLPSSKSSSCSDLIRLLARHRTRTPSGLVELRARVVESEPSPTSPTASARVGGDASAAALGGFGNTSAPPPPKKKWLRFEVHDNGPGVPADIHKRLFAEACVASHQAEAPSVVEGAGDQKKVPSSSSFEGAFTSRQGSGLGLFVVNMCAQDLGGSCGFNCANGFHGVGRDRHGDPCSNDTPASEPHLGGSVFWLDVPLVVSASGTFADCSEPENVKEVETTPPILLVPPKANMRTRRVRTESMPSPSSSAVQSSSSSSLLLNESSRRRIVTAAATATPTQLTPGPVKQGVRRRWQSTSNSSIAQYVIGLSANAEDSDIEASKTAGIDDFIPKPVKVSQIVERLETQKKQRKERGQPTGRSTS